MRRTSLASVFFLLLFHWAQAAAPTLDASGIATGFFNSASSGSVSVTTTSTNDIVVIFIQVTKRSGAAPTVSSISGGGLTWAKRKAVTATYASACFSGNTCQGDFEEWWAFSSSTLSGTSVTVTLSASTDECGLGAFGVNGAGSSIAPFDTNVGLPTSAQNLTSTPNTVQATVSTTEDADLIFEGRGSGASFVLGGGTQTCSGWTQAGVVDSSGPNDYATLWAGVKSYTGVQSSLALPFYGASCTGTQSGYGWTVIADAITNGVAQVTGGLMFKSGPGW